MELKDYVRKELELVSDESIPAKAKQDITNFVVEIEKQFDDRDYANVMYRLLSHRPLTPLTGADDEWEAKGICDDAEGDHTVYQNLRCGSVFKRGKNGRPFDMNGRALYDVNGNFKGYMKTYITFPYTVPMNPSRIIVSYKDEFSGEEIDV